MPVGGESTKGDVGQTVESREFGVRYKLGVVKALHE